MVVEEIVIMNYNHNNSNNIIKGSSSTYRMGTRKKSIPNRFWFVFAIFNFVSNFFCPRRQADT